MKTLLLIVAATLAQASALALAQGQLAQSQYSWKDAGTGQFDLFKNGKPIGSYFNADGKYFPWDGQHWGKESPCPATPPSLTLYKGQFLFGVDESKLTNVERFICPRGYEVTRDTILELLTTSNFEDDSKKRHLTIVCKDGLCKKLVEKDCAAEMRILSKSCRPQVYDYSRLVDREMLSPFKVATDKRFLTAGAMLILQEPEDEEGLGKVVLQAYGSTQDFVDALRKINPDWPPDQKKPVPPPPSPTPAPESPHVEPEPNHNVLLIVGGMIVAALILRRK